MHPYYSAQEIADSKLADLPETKAGILNLAKREGWIVQDRFNRWQPTSDIAGTPLSQKRREVGGGWEYHYSLLPQEAFNDFVNRGEKKKLDAGETAKAVEVAFKRAPDDLAQLNQWQRDVMEARAAILG